MKWLSWMGDNEVGYPTMGKSSAEQHKYLFSRPLTWAIMLLMQATRSLTGQLRLYSGGNQEVADSILREILPRLRQIAVWKLSNGKSGNSMSPTDLIDETWLSRLHRGKWKIDDREHFFSIAGLAMEQVLKDMARKRLAQRRGNGAFHLSLDEIPAFRQPVCADAEQLLAISLLLGKLAEADPLAANIVRAHYFVGFSLEEIAKETGLSFRQVRHRWEKGKAWLATRLAVEGAQRGKTRL